MTKQENGRRPEDRKAQLYYLRRAAKLTQTEFASKIGIHLVTLCRLENYRIVPSHELAETIGKVTNQSPGEVIDEYLKQTRKPVEAPKLKRRTA